MHGPACPGTPEVRAQAFTIQVFGDLPPADARGEQAIHAAHGFDLFVRSRNEDDTVSLEALSFAGPEFAIRSAMLVDQKSPKSESGHAALAVAALDQPALSREDLDRQLPAVFSGHHAFHGLEEYRADAAVVVELFSAKMHREACPPTEMFVIGTLVGILEPTPAAYVVDEDGVKVGAARRHVGHQLLDRLSSVDGQAAPPGVLVCGHDLEAPLFGEGDDECHLVIDGKGLWLGRHAHVGGSAYRSLFGSLPRPDPSHASRSIATIGPGRRPGYSAMRSSRSANQSCRSLL